MFKPKLREYATKALTDRTVEVKTGTAVASVAPTRVTLKSGEELKAHTLVWGAGLQGNELVHSLGVELQRGNRIAVGPDLTLADHPEVYVLGDVAAITDSKTEQVLPQLGSVALQSGEHAGETIARRIAGKKLKPFAYKDKGTMATIGRGAAVVQFLGGKTMTGVKAQLAWGTVHLALLPTNEDRAKAVVDWAGAAMTHQRAGRITVGGGLGGVLTLASNLGAARSQMAFTLGFHIVLASLGVALPAMMLIANYRGLRRDDPDALKLAQRWSKAVAVTFAVGAVTGTVLSFEFGLLWPAFTGRFGEVFGVLFAIEGIFFFLEAIFIAIYIFGWKRLSPWAHFWTGVPVVICGLRRGVLGRRGELVDEPAAGVLADDGQGHLGRPVEGDLQPGGPLRGPAHDPGGLPRHRVPGRLDLRGRDAARPARPHPPARAADPADGRLHRDADPVRGRRHGGPCDRRASADQVRGDGVRARRPRPTSPSTSSAGAPRAG